MRLNLGRMPAVLAAVALAGPTLGVLASGTAQAAVPLVPVIVAHDGSGTAEAVVQRVGGTVGQRLAIVDSFTARVPASAVPALAASAGVRSVTPDGQVRLQGDDWDDDGDDETWRVNGDDEGNGSGGGQSS